MPSSFPSLRPAKLNRLSRWVAAVAVVAVATTAGLIGSGVFGAFSGTTSASGTATAGTITLNSIGTGDTTLDTAVSNVAPGDTLVRVVRLTNGGNQAFKSISVEGQIASLGGSGTATVANWASSTTVTVEVCTGTTNTWTSDTNYTCSGGTPWTTPATTVTLGTSVATYGAAAAVTTALAGGAATTLRITLVWSTSMNNTYQTGVPTYTFRVTGNQRDGTTK